MFKYRADFTPTALREAPWICFSGLRLSDWGLEASSEGAVPPHCGWVLLAEHRPEKSQMAPSDGTDPVHHDGWAPGNRKHLRAGPRNCGSMTLKTLYWPRSLTEPRFKRWPSPLSGRTVETHWVMFLNCHSGFSLSHGITEFTAWKNHTLQESCLGTLSLSLFCIMKLFYTNGSAKASGADVRTWEKSLHVRLLAPPRSPWRSGAKRALLVVEPQQQGERAMQKWWCLRISSQHRQPVIIITITVIFMTLLNIAALLSTYFLKFLFCGCSHMCVYDYEIHLLHQKISFMRTKALDALLITGTHFWNPFWTLEAATK